MVNRGFPFNSKTDEVEDSVKYKDIFFYNDMHLQLQLFWTLFSVCQHLRNFEVINLSKTWSYDQTMES